MKAQRRLDDLYSGYTVADYMRWPEDIRCELIDGTIYDMSPAPTIVHQRLLVGLSSLLQAVLQRRKGNSGCDGCELFVAPIDVVLSANSVVQPDLIVVCDPAKLANGKHVIGAPDLVVEILSPSTAVKDKREKRCLYEQAAVPEYLIINPAEFYAEYYRLDNGAYGLPIIWSGEDIPRLALFPGLDVKLSDMFGWPAPAEPLSMQQG